MGLSKKAFLVSAGFGRVHPGEDPDLSIRLWKLGFETRLFPKVFVYHKRRISWSKFYIQVNKFGKVRNILNAWHPEHKKLTYWFPALFIVGLFVSLLLVMIGIPQLFRLYVFYFILVFIASLVSEKNLKIAFLSLLAVFIQLYGYGKGFLEGWYRIVLRRKKPEEAFPNLFF